MHVHIYKVLFLFPSSTDFLERLQKIGSQHNFFYPGYTPNEMDQLPALYKDILEQPGTFLNSFQHAPSKFLLSNIVTILLVITLANKVLVVYKNHPLRPPVHMSHKSKYSQMDEPLLISLDTVPVYNLRFA